MGRTLTRRPDRLNVTAGAQAPAVTTYGGGPAVVAVGLGLRHAAWRPVLTGVVVCPFAAAVAALMAWRAARGGQPAFVVAMRVLFVLYLGWVVGATLFPLPIRAEVASLESVGRGVSVSLVPLASIRGTLRDGTRFAQVWLIGGNVLTLAPFGFLLPFIAPRLDTM